MESAQAGTRCAIWCSICEDDNRSRPAGLPYVDVKIRNCNEFFI